MKKFFTLFAAALLLTAGIMLLNTVSASAAPNVVYVAANGKGNGSSPNSPIGNDANYTIAVGSHVNNALYRALDRLKSTGGTIVIVGEVSIDTASSRVPANKNDKKAPSEFKSPQFKANTSVKVTSVYNGVDYRKQGAKLIFDHDKCNTAGFFFGCKAEVADINIQYRYDPDSKNAWGTTFMFGGNGHPLTIGENVNVTSYNAKTKTNGSLYPMLIGGHRYDTSITNTDLTVKSGTWSTVIAGSFGMMDSSKEYGTINGNATLKIEGGKIGTVIGTGSTKNPSGTVKGNLSITVTGGDINDFYVCNDVIFRGRNIDITLGKNAKIDHFYYAPESYFGSIDDLAARVKITNNSSVKTALPQAETLPFDDYNDNETSPEDNKPKNNVKYDNILDMINDDTYKFIHPTILVGVLICCALIAAGFGVKFLLKKLKVK